MAGRELAIRITATDVTGAALRSVQHSLTGLGTAASLPGKALGGMFSGVAAAVKAPIAAVGGLVDVLGKIGLAGMGVQAVAGSLRGLGDAMGVGLQNEMEQISAQFNAFTKDGAETARILAKVRDEANKTPFAFAELARTTATLMPAAKAANIDLDNLVKTAEVLAASNPAQGLEGAAFSLREALSGDFVSIVERFNLPRQRLNELKDQGVPAIAAVRIAMKEMGYDMDLVANMANTLQGRWSTFNDTIDTLRMKISAPIFDALKNGLVGLQGYLDANMSTFEEWAGALAGNIGGAIATASKALGDMGSAVGKLIGYFRGGNTTDLMGMLFGSRMGYRIDEAVRGLKSLFGTLGNLKSLAADVAGGKLDLGRFLDVSGQTLGPIVEGLKGSLGNLAGALGEVLGQQWAKIDWVAVWAQAKGIGGALLGGLGDISGSVLGWLGEQWAKIKWADVWAKAGDIAGDIGGKLGDIAGSVQTWLGEQWGKIKWADVWAKVTGLGEGLATALAGAVTGIPIIEDVKKVLDDLAPTGERVSAFFGVMRDAVLSLVDKLAPLTIHIQSFVKQTADSAPNTKDFTNAVNAMSAALESAAKWLGENKALQAALAGLLAAAGTAWALATISVLAHAVAANGAALATQLWAVAQAALNLALTANPIGLVITLVAGLAAGLLYAYNNSEDFRKAVDAAWEGLKAFGNGIADVVGSKIQAFVDKIAKAVEWVQALVAAAKSLPTTLTAPTRQPTAGGAGDVAYPTDLLNRQVAEGVQENTRAAPQRTAYYSSRNLDTSSVVRRWADSITQGVGEAIREGVKQAAAATEEAIARDMATALSAGYARATEANIQRDMELALSAGHARATEGRDVADAAATGAATGATKALDKLQALALHFHWPDGAELVTQVLALPDEVKRLEEGLAAVRGGTLETARSMGVTL